jgi:hypothetical protein
MLARLMRARLPNTNARYTGDEDAEPAVLVLAAPVVLDHRAVNGVLNIGAERRMDYHTPPSVFISQVLRQSVTDLIPGDAEFERDFDTFETLLAMRYVADGGRGVPTGQYVYRGQRSFVGRGIPERIHLEMQREGAGWPPTASGLFASADQAECAFHEFSPPDFTRIRHLNSLELAARFTGFGRTFHG